METAFPLNALLRAIDEVVAEGKNSGDIPDSRDAARLIAGRFPEWELSLEDLAALYLEEWRPPRCSLA